MNQFHVVLGGSGGVGRAVATRLAEQKKNVRAVNRSGEIDGLPDGVDVKAADARDRHREIKTGDGATDIYH